MHNYEIIRETIFTIIGERHFRSSQMKIILEVHDITITITDSQVTLQKLNSKKPAMKIDTKLFCEDWYQIIRDYEDS